MKVPVSCQPVTGLWNQANIAAKNFPQNRPCLQRRARLTFEPKRDLSAVSFSSMR